jgi:hypothetical protein
MDEDLRALWPRERKTQHELAGIGDAIARDSRAGRWSPAMATLSGLNMPSSTRARAASRFGNRGCRQPRSLKTAAKTLRDTNVSGPRNRVNFAIYRRRQVHHFAPAAAPFLSLPNPGRTKPGEPLSGLASLEPEMSADVCRKSGQGIARSAQGRRMYCALNLYPTRSCFSATVESALS